MRHFLIVIFIKPSFPRESSTLDSRLEYCKNIKLRTLSCRHVTLQKYAATRSIYQLHSFATEPILCKLTSRSPPMGLSPCYVIFMSTLPLRGQKGQNEIRYMKVLPLFPITPSSAEVARRYGRVCHVFSGLISIFVFDIVQIRSGCCPPTCVLSTHLQFPGYGPKATLPIYSAADSRHGIYNNRNSHICAEENLQCNQIRHCQLQMVVNIWADIVGNHLMRPNSACVFECIYLPPILEHSLPELLGNMPLAVCREIWCRYGRAPVHFGRGAPEYLNRIFPRRWICRGRPTVWPASSPDLTPPDLFLWSHLTKNVQETPIGKQEELLTKIITAFDIICQHTGVFELILQSIFRSCTSHIEAGCRHLEQLLSELACLPSVL